MARPTVSVLMAVHNTEAYVQDAINSIRAQTLSDLELIVVDDGSSDESWRLVEEASAKDARIVGRRRAASGGASAALNDGLALATGEYLTRQDADDLSEPTRLAEQVAFLHANHSCGAVGTQATFIAPDGTPVGETSFPLVDTEIQTVLCESMCFVGPTVMASRTAFERAGLRFDPELSSSEDYDLCLRLAEVGGLANLPRPLYRYRQHGASVSHSRRHVQLFRKALALENAMGRRHGSHPPPEALIDVARDYLRAAFVAQRLGEREWVGISLRQALRVHPAVLEEVAIVERVIRRYLPTEPAASLAFAESLFEEVLPRTEALVALRRRLAADLHLRHAFDGPRGADVRHLWSALRSDPRSVLAHGVVARLLRGAFGQSEASRGMRP